MKKVKKGYECNCISCKKDFLVIDPLSEGFNFCKACQEVLIKKYKDVVEKEMKDLPF